MTTARFLVTLTRSHNELCRVERSVRRATRERAVLYGQLWLIKAQRLAIYAGVTYDVYEIFEKDDSGQWVPVEIGGVDSAETGRTRARETRQETPKASHPRESKAPKTGRGTRAKGDGDRTSPGTGANKWEKIREWSQRPPTPLQLRIAEAKRVAYQTIADRKARGDK